MKKSELRSLIREEVKRIIREGYNDPSNWENNWGLPIPNTGITKDQVREAVGKVFGSGHFGTLGPGGTKVEGSDTTMKINIANAGGELVDTIKGKKLGDILSALSTSKGGKPLKFKKFTTKKYNDDISSYEPGKITGPKIVSREDLYVVISTK